MARKKTADRRSNRYPVDLPAWQSLTKHYREDIRGRHLRDFFRRDSRRTGRYTLQAADLHVDFSKNYLSAKTRRLLLQLARQAGVPAAIDAMFSGETINRSEERPALHVALRAKMSDRVAHELPNIAEVWATLNRLEEFVTAVCSGEIHGHAGQPFTDIVNIGIGGSDLGIVMAARALRPYWREGVRFHSVSNIDGTQLADLRRELDPGRTLVIICSKTFTTLETMTNAREARAWLVAALGEAAAGRHFAAASTNHAAMDEFGIHPDYRFGFWDWVGGRFSIWSAVGLSLALVIGMDHFKAFLAGGRRLDQHFRSASLDENVPVMLAMLAIWNNNFLGAESQAILPYDNRLDRFPAFLQQLQMESNGKRVRDDGKRVKTDTGMVIWGEAGSNAQHSFYQLLHQGTRFVPVDFIVPVMSSGSTQSQQDLALANCLAQGEALMDGYPAKRAEADLLEAGASAAEARALAPHKEHPGGRPSTTILFEHLSPEALGQLVALYEHKVYVEGLVWGINSFDQWGVELGKKLASGLASSVGNAERYDGDNPSTRWLLELASRLRRQ